MPTVAQIENADPLIASEAMRLLAAIRAAAIYRDNRHLYPDVETKIKAEIERKKAITGATSASPIVITAIAHGFADGDLITVDGAGGNTAANGAWQASIVTTDTLTLFGSTGNAAYTSGGFVIGLISQHLAAIVAALDEVGDGTVGVKGGRQGVDYSQTRDREALIAEALDAMYTIADAGATVAIGQRGSSSLPCGCWVTCHCSQVPYAGLY
jgi:hypothetical protein